MTLFQGIYVSLLYSDDKKTIKSFKPEVFLSLDLSVSQTTRNLYDCLDGFIDPELMDGDNAWYNEETCKRKMCIRICRSGVFRTCCVFV
jgi:ubiquitin C-terminal hydrolase